MKIEQTTIAFLKDHVIKITLFIKSRTIELRHCITIEFIINISTIKVIEEWD